MMCIRRVGLFLLVLASCEPGWTQVLTAPAAQIAFAEAKTLSDVDAGKMWGLRLYGPMLFVDPATGEAIGNEADAKGMLRPESGVFLGRLPETMPIANTAVDWEGKRWTMVQWPLPENRVARARLLAHEMFHRIEPPLGIPVTDAPNEQLDTGQGRVWTLLEWRALAAALAAQTKSAQDGALNDAILFRAHRRSLFAGSNVQEDVLELNEGLAEYTGVMLSEPDSPSAYWHAIARLDDPSLSQSFVRSFAYTSGPAYGLLLDARVPGWRKHLKASTDLTELVARTVKKGPPALTARASLYGSSAIESQEAERKRSSDRKKEAYRALLVSGPTLTLPILSHFNFSFDPGELTPLDNEGMVYPSLHASDD